jgi:hypothetical protein
MGTVVSFMLSMNSCQQDTKSIMKMAKKLLEESQVFG